jgi:hypothetical protein
VRLVCGEGWPRDLRRSRGQARRVDDLAADGGGDRLPLRAGHGRRVARGPRQDVRVRVHAFREALVTERCLPVPDPRPALNAGGLSVYVAALIAAALARRALACLLRASIRGAGVLEWMLTVRERLAAAWLSLAAGERVAVICRRWRRSRRC